MQYQLRHGVIEAWQESRSTRSDCDIYALVRKWKQPSFAFLAHTTHSKIPLAPQDTRCFSHFAEIVPSVHIEGPQPHGSSRLSYHLRGVERRALPQVAARVSTVDITDDQEQDLAELRAAALLRHQASQASRQSRKDSQKEAKRGGRPNETKTRSNVKRYA